MTIGKNSPRSSATKSKSGSVREDLGSNRSNCGTPVVGEAVIARWLTDKRWYAATVKDYKNGR